LSSNPTGQGVSVVGQQPPTVVFAHRRSGSTWLGQVLNAHPEVTLFGEIFHRGRATAAELAASHAPAPQGFRPLPVPRLLFMQFAYQSPGRFAALRYLTQVVEEGDSAGTVGFKLMYDQLKEHPSVLGWLVLRRARVIHLVRRNPAHLAVSLLISRDTGVWHSKGPAADRVFSIDPAEVATTVRKVRTSVNKARAVLRCLPIRSTEVYYEDLASSPSSSSAQLFRFLGLEPVAYSADDKLSKVIARGYDEVLSNFDAVQEKLRAEGMPAL
jgi:LPS sulfotransferase NodH